MLHAFFKKYGYSLLYLLVVALLLFFFVPNEKKHYFDGDVKAFHESYYWKIMSSMAVGIYLLFFYFLKIYRNSWKEIGKSTLAFAIVCLFFSFLFQNIFMAFLLRINRTNTCELIKENYVITHDDPHYLIAKELKSNAYIFDKEFFNVYGKLGKKSLHVNDTLQITSKKGLLGIKFH